MLTIFPKRPNFDFMGKKFYFLTLSVIVVVGSFLLIFIKGFRWGIDFAGGIELQVRFQTPLSISEVRSRLKDFPYGEPSVQEFGESAGREFLIRIGLREGVETSEISASLRQVIEDAFRTYGPEIRREELVGPKVGEELRNKGILSMVIAMIGMLIYIAFRFEFRFGVGAILTLFHDPVIVLACFSLLNKEVNLQTVAAILTLIGYSINDTIVVFDRIREEMRRNRKEPLEPLLNRAINETLSRTVLTSLATLFTMIALFFFTPSGSVIHDFAFAMILGIIIGTYSSIYIASPIVLFLERRRR